MCVCLSLIVYVQSRVGLVGVKWKLSGWQAAIKQFESFRKPIKLQDDCYEVNRYDAQMIWLENCICIKDEYLRGW